MISKLKLNLLVSFGALLLTSVTYAQAPQPNKNTIFVGAIKSTVPEFPEAAVREFFMQTLVRSGSFFVATQGPSYANYAIDGMLVEIGQQPGVANPLQLQLRVYDARSLNIIDQLNVNSNEGGAKSKILGGIGDLLMILGGSMPSSPSSSQPRQQALENYLLAVVGRATETLSAKYAKPITGPDQMIPLAPPFGR